MDKREAQAVLRDILNIDYIYPSIYLLGRDELEDREERIRLNPDVLRLIKQALGEAL